MEFENVGSVKKHCDTLNPPSDLPLSFVSFRGSPWTAWMSLLVSNEQASVLGRMGSVAGFGWPDSWLATGLGAMVASIEGSGVLDFWQPLITTALKATQITHVRRMRISPPASSDNHLGRGIFAWRLMTCNHQNCFQSRTAFRLLDRP